MIDRPGGACDRSGSRLGAGNLTLAHAGADVALELRDKATGVELTRQIESMGRRAFPLQMDVMRLVKLSGRWSTPRHSSGKSDILVNNAGGGFTNLAADVPESEFDATLALNVKSTFFASQAAAKIMARHGRRQNHQYEFASGFRGVAHRIGVLRQQSRNFSINEMFGSGSGARKTLR